MRIPRGVRIGAICAITIGTAIGLLMWYLAFQSVLDLKRQAARTITAWVFEDKPIPGFVESEYRRGRGYIGSDRVGQTKQWYIDCDFLPQYVSLSDDPGLTRISTEDISERLERERESPGSKDSAFLVMQLQSVSRNRIEISIMISYSGGTEGVV